MYPDHLSFIVGSGLIIDRLTAIATRLTLPTLANGWFVKNLKDKLWTHLVFPTYIDEVYVSGWVEIPIGATLFVFPKQQYSPCYLIGKNINCHLGSPTKFDSSTRISENYPYFIVADKKIPLDQLTYYVVELCNAKY
jgi:hypothetical protein